MSLFLKKSVAELQLEADRGILRRSLGPLNLTTLGIGSIIGWDLILENALATSMVAVGWSGYLVSLLRDAGIIVPPQLAAPPGVSVMLADGSTVMGVFNLPATLIVLAGMRAAGDWHSHGRHHRSSGLTAAAESAGPTR